MSQQGVVAIAAAAASSPGVKNTVLLDSLDCKILQYRYGLTKLDKMIREVRCLKIKAKMKQFIPNQHYIMLLSGNVFNVQEQLLTRLSLLVNDRSFNSNQVINPPVVTKPINYDVIENLNDLTVSAKPPNLKDSLQSLDLFENLCMNAVQIYNKKIAQATNERNALRTPDITGTPVAMDIKQLEDLMLPLELSIIPNLITTNNRTQTTQESIDIALRNFEIYLVGQVVPAIERSLNALGTFIKQLETIKSVNQLVNTPHHQYLNHRIFITLLRLADLYSIMRKIGSRIAAHNYENWTTLLKYNNALKKPIIEADVFFNQSKKNGILLSLINRLTRQGCVEPVRVSTAIEYSKYSVDCYNLVRSVYLVLEKINIHWGPTVELSRKKITSSPIESSQVDNKKTSGVNSITSDLESSRLGSLKETADSTPRIQVSEHLSQPDSAVPANRSRSSSVNSASSTLSRTSSLGSRLSPQLQRNGSITSQNRRSLAVPDSWTSPTPSANSNPNKSPLSRRHSVNLSSPRSKLSPTPSAVVASKSATLAKKSPSTSPTPSPTRKDPVKAPLSNQIKEQAKPLTAQQRLQQHILNGSKRGTIQSKPFNEYSQNYDPRNHKSASNGSRNNSFQSALENPISSRNSSIQSSRNNSLRENIQKTPSNSISNEPATTSNNGTVARRGSISRKPDIHITSINEDTVHEKFQEKASQTASKAKTTLTATRGRSRASSNVSNKSYETVGNLEVVKSVLSNDDLTNKKVRFTGVPEYSEAEDKPSVNQNLKQFRQFVSRAPGLGGVRKKEKMLTAQEGLAFRRLHGKEDYDFEGFSRGADAVFPVDANGKVSMMSAINQPTNRKSKFGRLFKKGSPA
ncbi:hypothetical protein PP7435_CHR3-0493 [Komagataella phaffii CBS 7435]|uniref:Uncharacterized protein n=2 Tax=Komagataella phaffii TaxID=460519 RepID=C4R5C0_KOMPG|nr:Hypothetical protein PAS_chr3_0705 [Komagataella phaffii GS115]AOA63549.1 GQ67_03797T0 [Komagataella phaffii]CAH2449466.1 hypothetical protein BQ9382_C3-2635 [Komagataella phaffii CBS 7435]AOA68616.1 GQ68_03769T0 [Komagataella phaffii GS115]CAY70756.1 Hypothetical protein PAS_chr3_0705 [Komagataella phaffii GS115]CCA39453.1 hypothetical protein PP7435_CHR3-0493 [Komagataella phaffii CBS 7435]